MLSISAFAATNLVADVIANAPEEIPYQGEWQRGDTTNESLAGYITAKRYDGTDGKVIYMNNVEPTTHWMSQPFEGLKPNTNYVLYAMIKTKNVIPYYQGCCAFIGISFTSDGKTNDTALQGVGATTDWSLRYIEFKTPADVSEARIGFNLTATGGEAWFDQITLIEGTKADIPAKLNKTTVSSNSSKTEISSSAGTSSVLGGIGGTSSASSTASSAASSTKTSSAITAATDNDGLSTTTIILIVAGGVILLAGAGVAAYFLIIKKKKA